MSNWNQENSACLLDCKIESNIDNKPLVNQESEDMTNEYNEQMNNEVVSDEEISNPDSVETFVEDMRGRRRRPSARIQYIGYGRPHYRRRFFPVIYDRPIFRPFFYRDPVIINREVPVIKKDPEMHFGVEKLVILLIVLILLVGGGLFLLRKN